MNLRSLLAAVTGIAFLLMVSMQDLRAAAADPGSADEIHVVAGADLHDAVLTSSAEEATARKAVQDFLARSEVGTQIERMGFSPAFISLRVALLSDTELLRLQSQVMTFDQQLRTAGRLPGWAIALIAVGAVVVVIAVLYGIWYAQGGE
jgi:hypothetical protein